MPQKFESESFSRTVKALGVAANIQTWCAYMSGLDDDDPRRWRHDDEEYDKLIQRFIKAASHPTIESNQQILAPHAEHCFEYPSRATWDAVKAVLIRFTVIDADRPYREHEI